MGRPVPSMLVEDDLTAAEAMQQFKDALTERGLPLPRSDLALAKVDVSWRSLVESYAKDAEGTWLGAEDGLAAMVEAGVQLQPCVLCEGHGVIWIEYLGDPTVHENECAACNGLRVLPSRASVRLWQQQGGYLLQASKTSVQNLDMVDSNLQGLAELGHMPDGRPLDIHIQMPVRGADGRYHPDDAVPVVINTKDDIRRVRRQLADERARIEEDIAIHSAAMDYVNEVMLLVNKARACKDWLDDLDAHARSLEQPAPPPPVRGPAHAPTCVVCGKPGTVQDEGGQWWCKKHGHEQGLLQPPVPKEEPAPLCDFCEQRDARYRYEDILYCGPCAEAAQLPDAKEEVAAA